MLDMEGTRIYKNFHQWLLPSRAVVGILALGSVFVFVGIVLLATGSSGLAVGGAVFLGVGLILVILCMLLCMYACFVLYVKDQATQTQQVGVTDAEMNSTRDAYAVINKKPPPSPSSNHNSRIGKGDRPSRFVTIGDSSPHHNSSVSSKDKENRVEYYKNNSEIVSKYENERQSNFQQKQDAQRFPLNSSQPTPYSTLRSPGPYEQHSQIQTPHLQNQHHQQQQEQHQQQQLQQQQQQQMCHAPGYGVGFSLYSNEDYDNPVESTPLTTPIQQYVHWTPDTYNADDDVMEPTPLQHPSAKRPMVFNKVSSSKMSIYDNVQFNSEI